MAIIVIPDPAAQEAARPAFPVEGETVRGASSHGAWSQPLASATEVLSRAFRATARLETSNKDLEFIGTAFAVAPTLAAVTGHVAQSMLRKRDDGPEILYHLNFFADESDARTSIGVRVKLIHPYFDFALLEMERAVKADSILHFSSSTPEIGEEIALIGYPLNDLRNDPSLLAGLFGGVFGKKRIMPGRVLSSSATAKTAGVDVPALAHDASCTSGTSGAPVVRLATGEVVGVHYAGVYLERNFAVPAWELANDPFLQLSELCFTGSKPNPSWLPLWKSRLSFVDADIEAFAKKSFLPDVPPAKSRAHLLTADDLSDVKDILVRAGFGSDFDVKDLFDGLPVELRAELPSASTASATILRCLRNLNRRTGLLDFEHRTPLHVTLRSACSVKSTDAGLKASLQTYMTVLSEHEHNLKMAAPQGGHGITSLAIPEAANFRRIATAIARLGRKSVRFIGLAEDELDSPVRPTQITFQDEVEGLKMLRGLSQRRRIKPYDVAENASEFILKARGES
ncbi:hypothetical protein ACVWZ4_002849 [Bradyrhizobium sp. USDA 4472]